MSSSLSLSGAWIASLPANCRCNSASVTHDKPQSFFPRLSERQLKEPRRRLYSFCHCLAVKILLADAWRGLVSHIPWQIISLPQLEAVFGKKLSARVHLSPSKTNTHTHKPECRYNKSFIPAGGRTRCTLCTSSSRKLTLGPRLTSPGSEVLVSGVRQSVTCPFTPARTVLTLSH